MSSVKVRTFHLEVRRCGATAGDFPKPQLQSVKTPPPFSEEEWKVSSLCVAVRIYERCS
jgi:hypothetical protein